MNDAQKLFELLDRVKKLIQENSEPDGICRFNFEQINCLLEVAEIVLQDTNYPKPN